MKKQIKIIAIFMLCMLILSACNNNTGESVEAKTTETEALSGGWEAAQDNEITAERKAIFDKATETLTGATYTPVTYLGSQVVAGTNHAFLCKSEPSVEELKTSPTWIIVYIYQDLEGKCEIIKTEEVELNI